MHARACGVGCAGNGASWIHRRCKYLGAHSLTHTHTHTKHAGIDRRFQWGFFRLEHEHINNTEEYRVVQEIPLPYGVTEAETASPARVIPPPGNDPVIKQEPVAENHRRPDSDREFVRVEPVPHSSSYDNDNDNVNEHNDQDRAEVYTPVTEPALHRKQSMRKLHSQNSVGRRVARHAVGGDWDETPEQELTRSNSDLILPYAIKAPPCDPEEGRKGS